MTESSVAGNDDRRRTHQNTTDSKTTENNAADGNSADQNMAAPIKPA